MPCFPFPPWGASCVFPRFQGAVRTCFLGPLAESLSRAFSFLCAKRMGDGTSRDGYAPVAPRYFGTCRYLRPSSLGVSLTTVAPSMRPPQKLRVSLERRFSAICEIVCTLCEKWSVITLSKVFRAKNEKHDAREKLIKIRKSQVSLTSVRATQARVRPVSWVRLTCFEYCGCIALKSRRTFQGKEVNDSRLYILKFSRRKSRF